MLKRLQERNIKKKIKKYLEHRDTSLINNKVQTFGFLVDEDMFHDFEKLTNIAIDLGIRNNDISIFTFVESKSKTPSLRQNQVNNKEFSWKGELKNKNALDFLAIKLDVLVGFYQDNNMFLNLMMAKSKANFKVGFFGCDNNVFDLIIDVNPQKLNSFKSELLKYLRVLGKLN